MGSTEWFLLALVILVPLIIAIAVTLWSLKQVRYRPKRRVPRPPLKMTEPSSTGDPPTSPTAS